MKKAIRIFDGKYEEVEVTKCSKCPFSYFVWAGLTRPSQQDCHHPEIIPWDHNYGRPYLFEIGYESFPDWCPLDSAKIPVFDKLGNQILNGTLISPKRNDKNGSTELQN